MLSSFNVLLPSPPLSPPPMIFPGTTGGGIALASLHLSLVVCASSPITLTRFPQEMDSIYNPCMCLPLLFIVAITAWIGIGSRVITIGHCVWVEIELKTPHPQLNDVPCKDIPITCTASLLP